MLNELKKKYLIKAVVTSKTAKKIREAQETAADKFEYLFNHKQPMEETKDELVRNLVHESASYGGFKQHSNAYNAILYFTLAVAEDFSEDK